jgi:hypothetical protein
VTGSDIKAPLVSQNPYGLYNIVDIVKRFAHAHENNIVYRPSQHVAHREYLGDYFLNPQIAAKTSCARGTEAAAHTAAGLARHAQRGPALDRYDNRFNPHTVKKPENYFCDTILLKHVINSRRTPVKPIREAVARRGVKAAVFERPAVPVNSVDPRGMYTPEGLNTLVTGEPEKVHATFLQQIRSGNRAGNIGKTVLKPVSNNITSCAYGNRKAPVTALVLTLSRSCFIFCASQNRLRPGVLKTVF